MVIRRFLKMGKFASLTGLIDFNYKGGQKYSQQNEYIEDDQLSYYCTSNDLNSLAQYINNLIQTLRNLSYQNYSLPASVVQRKDYSTPGMLIVSRSKYANNC